MSGAGWYNEQLEAAHKKMMPLEVLSDCQIQELQDIAAGYRMEIIQESRIPSERLCAVVGNGGTGVWINEDRRKPFTELQAHLIAHAHENVGMGVKLYSQVIDSTTPVGTGIDWEVESMSIEEIGEKDCEDPREREPKEFRPSYDKLNNVQKKVRKKTNRKKKKRR